MGIQNRKEDRQAILKKETRGTEGRKSLPMKRNPRRTKMVNEPRSLAKKKRKEEIKGANLTK